MHTQKGFARKATLFYFIIVFQTINLCAQGYKIKLNIKGASGIKAQFAYYQADKQYIIQNGVFDKSDKLSFEGKESLPVGIYLVVIENAGYFDLLIKNEFNFDISGNIKELQQSLKTKGSVENQLFFEYQQQVFKYKTKIAEIDSSLVKPGIDDNSKINLDKQKSVLDKELYELVYNFKVKNKSSYLAKILNAMEIADPDSMDFADPDLLRTPFYQNMIRLFIKKNINNNPKYIISETVKFLEKIKGTESNYQFVAGYLINFYNSFYKNGINEVFVFLADNYFLPDKAKWLNTESLKQLKDRRDFLSHGLQGTNAADLVLESTTGEYISLHQLKSKITFLYFWSVNCGHCTKSTKILLDHYEALSKNGVEIYAVNIDKEKEDWIKKVEENGLPWINCYDPKETSGYRDKYYVYGSPLLFAIDKDKKILAVKIGENEIEELTNQLIK